MENRFGLTGYLPRLNQGRGKFLEKYNELNDRQLMNLREY